MPALGTPLARSVAAGALLAFTTTHVYSASRKHKLMAGVVNDRLTTVSSVLSGGWCNGVTQFTVQSKLNVDDYFVMK